MGTLTATRPDLGFVEGEGTAYLSTPDGLERVSLDGRQRRVVFGGSWSVTDVSRDLKTFVLSNSNTDLYLGDAEKGQVRQVAALRGRFSAGTLSPDGRTLAASRHSDFSLPQELWKDDDALYLIDVQTLAVRVLKASSGAWPTRLAWTRDGTAVLAFMAFGEATQRVTVADGTRRAATAEELESTGLFESFKQTAPSCDARILDSHWATALQVETSGHIVTVAEEKGRKRGFHDYQPDFFEPRFTPTCRYVAFAFQQETWLASASGSGELSRLSRGWVLFFGPAFDPVPSEK
jgi:hypothetical protein